MLDKKAFEKSLHKFIISSIDTLTLMKLKFEMELNDKNLTQNKKDVFQADIRRINAIIEQILCLETMDEFYKLNYGFCSSLYQAIKSEGIR